MTIVPCDECREPIRVGAPGTFREVVGWVQFREGGGAHAIALERPTGRYVHRLCMELRRMNHSEQLGLFGDPP